MAADEWILQSVRRRNVVISVLERGSGAPGPGHGGDGVRGIIRRSMEGHPRIGGARGIGPAPFARGRGLELSPAPRPPAPRRVGASKGGPSAGDWMGRAACPPNESAVLPDGPAA